MWALAACAAVSALSPGELAGTALAMLCGFGTTLVLDCLSDGELYLWPRTGSPAVWFYAYPAESLVMLEGETFVIPCGCGAVPRPWAAWRVHVFRSAPAGKNEGRRIIDLITRRRDLFLSAGGLLALLAAVILK